MICKMADSQNCDQLHLSTTSETKFTLLSFPQNVRYKTGYSTWSTDIYVICIHNSRKLYQRLHSHRYWLVLVQDFRLVQYINRGWFLYKQKGVQTVTSRYNRIPVNVKISSGV